MAFWDARTLKDEGVREFVQQLISGDYLEDGAEMGIASQFLDPAGKPLTERQHAVLTRAIERNGVDRCHQCGSLIQWDEMYEARHGLDEDELCDECRGEQYRLHRAMERDD
jgi:hypothetical protein